MTSDELRFWDKVRIGDNCWEWTAGRSESGYGRFYPGPRRPRSVLAHRRSWEMANGPIPDGLLVCHRCDNPGCVRSSHLFLGTYADNAADKVSKSRQQRGERAAMAKLNVEKVCEVRRRCAAGEEQRDVARSLGVHQSAISKIVNRLNWGHVS